MLPNENVAPIMISTPPRMVIQHNVKGILPSFTTLLPPHRVRIPVTFSTPTPVYNDYR